MFPESTAQPVSQQFIFEMPVYESKEELKERGYDVRKLMQTRGVIYIREVKQYNTVYVAFAKACLNRGKEYRKKAKPSVAYVKALWDSCSCENGQKAYRHQFPGESSITPQPLMAFQMPVLPKLYLGADSI